MRLSNPTKSDLQLSQELLQLEYCMQPTSDNVTWLLKLASSDRSFICFCRNWGLMCDVAPFVESSNVVIVDDPAEVDRYLFQILPRIGVDIRKTFTGFVPFSMPPALTDVDRRLQEAHFAVALSVADDVASKDELFHATGAALQEQLGEASTFLAELNDADVAATLGAARTLVTEALKALHRTLRRQKSLEHVAVQAVMTSIEQAINEVGQKEKLREEWRRREHWVQRQSFERRAPKKGKNKARSAAVPQAPAKEDLKKHVQHAVEYVEQRSRLYRHISNSIAVLQQEGLLHRLCPEERRQQLGGQDLSEASAEHPESLHEGEVVELRLKRSQPLLKDRQSHASAVRPPRRGGFAAPIEEAKQRDVALALERTNEAAFKLGIEMSLADAAESRAPSEVAACTNQDAVGMACSHAGAMSIFSSFTDTSDFSIASAPARIGQARCFLPKTKFQSTDGQILAAVRLHSKGGEVVMDVGGQAVKVCRRTTLPEQERDVVELTVQTGRLSHTFKVTADHRVCVVNADDEQFAVCASELVAAPKTLWRVMTGGGAVALLNAKMLQMHTQVVEVVFEGDAEVLAWTPANHWRARTLSPTAGVVCRGSLARSSDLVAAAGVEVRRGFFEEKRGLVPQRSLSEGDLPKSPLWFSQGSLHHREGQPERCRVCVEHKRHTAHPCAPPCRYGVRCSRCHMPH
jgi:hypothetical protein